MNEKVLIGLIVVLILVLGCIRLKDEQLMSEQELIDECSGLCENERGVYSLSCIKWCKIQAEKEAVSPKAVGLK